MNLLRRRRRAPRPASTLAWTLGTLSALALANHALARLTERRHPPQGRFIEVDGTRLHYTDRGTGQPALLIHGNIVTGDDFNTSGVADLLLKTHRVIIFDRPGFGHSTRPRNRPWTAAEQAALIHKALVQIGIERPVVVGHSFGAVVALAFAHQHPEGTAGLVLLSGYYFPTLRPDAWMAAIGAAPVLGDILRYTISPVLGWLSIPLLKRAFFSPAAVPARFDDEFSPSISLRPSQIRATNADGALMIPAVRALENSYGDLAMPVAIIAGDGDKVVFKRAAERLHGEIPGSTLEIVRGAGHMVHHLAARQVARAVQSVSPGRGQPLLG
ncbi:alpha/beta fold hydrolase [Muricoccus vinaceus]|uniref:Alpha/beta fold hydrolase n=1 Tax=Muricoccus vinaceus TaxID=424704 RepID=A0ABV6IS43_9PROT